jgi:hypothetical protein
MPLRTGPSIAPFLQAMQRGEQRTSAREQVKALVGRMLDAGPAEFAVAKPELKAAIDAERANAPTSGAGSGAGPFLQALNDGAHKDATIGRVLQRIDEVQGRILDGAVDGVELASLRAHRGRLLELKSMLGG